jgi:hypothetical protein
MYKRDVDTYWKRVSWGAPGAGGEENLVVTCEGKRKSVGFEDEK